MTTVLYGKNPFAEDVEKIDDIKEPYKKILKIRKHMEHYKPISQCLKISEQSDGMVDIQVQAYIDTSGNGVVNNFSVAKGIREALSLYFNKDNFSLTVVADQLVCFNYCGIQANKEVAQILKQSFKIFDNYQDLQKLEDILKAGRETGDEEYDGPESKYLYQKWLHEHNKKWYLPGTNKLNDFLYNR